MENESVIKLNSEKELTVNISSLEDLLNSIKYATEKMEQAKNGLSGVELTKDFSYIKTKLDLVLDKQTVLRDVVFDNFEKDVKKQLSTLPREETLQALIFELNRFNKVDTLLSKMNVKNVIVASLITCVLTVAAMSYTKVTDTAYQAFMSTKLKNDNFIIPKNHWVIEKSDAQSVELKRKSQLNSN